MGLDESELNVLQVRNVQTRNPSIWTDHKPPVKPFGPGAPSFWDKAQIVAPDLIEEVEQANFHLLVAVCLVFSTRRLRKDEISWQSSTSLSHFSILTDIGCIDYSQAVYFPGVGFKWRPLYSTYLPSRLRSAGLTLVTAPLPLPQQIKKTAPVFLNPFTINRTAWMHQTPEYRREIRERWHNFPLEWWTMSSMKVEIEKWALTFCISIIVHPYWFFCLLPGLLYAHTPKDCFPSCVLYCFSLGGCWQAHFVGQCIRVI